jgi:hypothetical protein
VGFFAHLHPDPDPAEQNKLGSTKLMQWYNTQLSTNAILVPCSSSSKSDYINAI